MLKKLLLGLIGVSIAFSTHAQVFNTKSELYDFLSMELRKAGYDVVEEEGRLIMGDPNDTAFVITGLSEKPNELNLALRLARNCTVSQKIKQIAAGFDVLVLERSGGSCVYGDLRSFYLPITRENYSKHFDNFIHRLGEINSKL
ncbi:hypothetical protein Q7469_03165 [Glaesserella parasuis]|uniref:Uncharacterized protein n=1 Tax=Glaesserella parasuis TaxID=738 RepID=A0AAJ6AJ64_GLAPU|nr:hypothetical protein [Glaesserella parasuis]MCT8761954.1 hypothetical protein [Glaesserella parasuis]MCT8766052.1 hypothetical protein [Glaesserella parasuis]MCT8770337.1 hypothetical protein [Glaesserella parasuis]MDD2165888.1 hypothetical protein [Glaesserella parasuis]MDE3964643.1 hypothetical protein [Glaesserella parasuis]